MSEMSITVTFPTRTYVREADGYYARRDDGGLIDCHTDSDVVWALDKAAALQQDLAAARAQVEAMTRDRAAVRTVEKWVQRGNDPIGPEHLVVGLVAGRFGAFVRGTHTADEFVASGRSLAGLGRALAAQEEDHA